MAVFGSYQTKLGVARETTPGTFAAPTRWLPTSAPKPKDDIKYYEDKAYRGLPTETFGHYGMGAWTQFDADGPFYPDSVGLLLTGAMGADALTTLATPTTSTGTTTAGTSAIAVTLGTTFTNGMAILVDTGALVEGNIILSGGTTTSLVVLSPWRFTHGAGATVAGSTVHKLTNAIPQTYSVWDSYAVANRQYTYGTVEKFGLKWSAQAEATYAATLRSQLSATSGAQTAAFTTVPPFMGWQSGVVIGGAAQLNLEDLQVDFTRKVTPVFAAANSQSPVQILASSLMVSGKATFQMATDAEFNLFRNGTVNILQFGLFGPALGFQGAAAASGLLLTISAAVYTGGVIERGKEYVQAVLNFTGDYNVTDGGPCAVQLSNGVTTLYTA
jgi:hypothetical protein